MRLLALPAALAAIGAVCCFAQTQASVAIVNYAGFTGDFPVAPGSIASAYGTFGSVMDTSAPGLSPMPTELSATRVRVNGLDSPLYFVSRTQINFVIPVATQPGRRTVEVVQGGNVVASGSVNVWEIAPGLASSDSTPNRQGIIQNQDFTINSQNQRARRGQIIQIYATGCGATNPVVQDGAPPSVLSPSTAQVKAYILDEAAVQFAGAHPQFPGICQVNATVPEKAISGMNPLMITVNGVASNPVSVWVE